MIENRCIMPWPQGFQVIHLKLSEEGIKAAHEWFQDELAHRFGGFTMSPGVGVWVDDYGQKNRENVVIYDVAMEDTHSGVDVFVKLCEELGKRLNQKCVYIRIDGKVSLITIHQEEFV